MEDEDGEASPQQVRMAIAISEEDPIEINDDKEGLARKITKELRAQPRIEEEIDEQPENPRSTKVGSLIRVSKLDD